MSRFRNEAGVVVSVAPDKDSRFGVGWVPADSLAEVAEPISDSSEPMKRGPGRPKKVDPEPVEQVSDES